MRPAGNSPSAAVDGRHPLRSALLAQVWATLAAALVALALWPASLAQPLLLALVQGGGAMAIAWRLRAPIWWLPIQFAFMPLAVLVHGMALPTWLWPGGFLLLLLVFWRVDRSQVPLYLTNRASCDALRALLPAAPCRVIDLGCGDGALLRDLARARPDCTFVGLEHAPLTWAWARWSARGTANLSIRYGDFWAHPLTGYDLAYAFLSPAAMPRLLAKASAEMCPGACLVSNSFVLPQRMAQATVDVPDRRRTRLHVYRDFSPPG